MKYRPFIASAAMLAVLGAAVIAAGGAWWHAAFMIAGVLAIAMVVARFYREMWRDGWDE